MVETPAEFSVPELINLLPSYTIPVTLVCAGTFLRIDSLCHPLELQGVVVFPGSDLTLPGRCKRAASPPASSLRSVLSKL